MTPNPIIELLLILAAACVFVAALCLAVMVFSYCVLKIYEWWLDVTYWTEI